MPLLQVKDCPEDLYEKLRMVAKAENRSISRQTIVLLAESLNLRKSNRERREALLNVIAGRTQPDKLKDIYPVLFVRENRDR